MNLSERLEQLQLVLVTGKGGTGKSAMTAALGRGLARRGRRTLLLEIDPRENLQQLCGVPPSGGQITEVRDRLYLQNLKPHSVADWVVKKQVKIDLLVERILSSAVYQRFVEGAPGLTEIAILGHVLRLVRGERDDAPPIDTVVLDAPATGHGIYLLTAARLFADAIGEGPFAALAREVAELVEDPERAGVVVVTLAEEMPVQEAIELRQALVERLGRPPELLIVNGLYPPVGEADGGCVPPPRSPRGDEVPVGEGDGGSVSSPRSLRRDGVPLGQADGGHDELGELWRHRRAVNDLEIGRLERRWTGPRIDVPLLPIDDGPHLVRLLQEHLDARLPALEAASDRGIPR